MGEQGELLALSVFVVRKFFVILISMLSLDLKMDMIFKLISVVAVAFAKPYGVHVARVQATLVVQIILSTDLFVHFIRYD